ncbi:MAG TPA: hypothetical protein P5041_03565, partial [Candidatus Cloacimonas sp.]|nr:hypothetical protein [Candidatus Cloacimonas sp.]
CGKMGSRGKRTLGKQRKKIVSHRFLYTESTELIYNNLCRRHKHHKRRKSYFYGQSFEGANDS